MPRIGRYTTATEVSVEVFDFINAGVSRDAIKHIVEDVYDPGITPRSTRLYARWNGCGNIMFTTFASDPQVISGLVWLIEQRLQVEARKVEPVAS